MSQANPITTTKRDATAAARAKRYRDRKRALVTVTQRDAAPVTAHEAPIHARVTVMPPRRHVSWSAVLLVFIALAIAALALVINGQTGWRFGTTPLAAVTFAGLALAADLLAIVLPAVAVTQWHAGSGGLSAAAWTTWVVATSLAALATLGFVELNTADTAAERQAIVASATAGADQRNAGIAAAQLAVASATKTKEAECLRRGPLCRDREADERAAMAALNTAIAVPMSPAPTIAAPDPQVTAVVRLTTWVGLKLSADDVMNLRLVLLAMLPNISGLVLMFGLALASPVRRTA